MYLKRLDLQGFKSFANKTTLTFGDGVTCVIGPNGTGKTNVADGIRWVLGEHSSRTLRARKTEDVIFGGSDKRPAMGVAEVSIALDNSGQWLPIEFEEVVVSRRAYRSGDNEYFINGSRVRLRDVVDLFMRGQVGQNSYAFMGQGMVEQVLSLRPEDRRALIEEAADVRIYRHRLEDSQARLKATRENLDRVRMLIGEIGPRIAQLERQAGRAIRYSELTRELAATLHVWYSHQWQEANRNLLAALAAQDQRAEEFDQAKAAAKACADGSVQLRAAIEERRDELVLREDRLRALQGYVRDLERRVALDDQRGTQARARLKELSAELRSLRDDEAAQGDPGAHLDTIALEDRLEATRGELAELRQRHGGLEGDLSGLRAQALAHEEANARARARVDDLTRRIEDAASAAARIRREHASSLDERSRLLGRLAAWAKDFARAARDLAVLGPQIGWHLDERQKANDAIASDQRQRAQVDEDLLALREQARALQAKLEVLEEFEIRPQAPDGGVRAILEAGGVIARETVPADIELSGVVGLLHQLVRFPAGLERAMEAALAENLYAVVVEREADMRAAIDLLLGGDAGRATIYPLDSFHETRPLNLMKERGVVGVASQLVRCDSRHRRLVDTLLGRTIVVETLPHARRVVSRGLAGAVATLDGVLLRPIGSAAAGANAIVEAGFVRGRELDVVPGELARLQPEIDRREATLAAVSRSLADEQQHLAGLDTAIDELRGRSGRVETDLAALRALLPGFRVGLRPENTAQAIVGEQTARLSRQSKQFERERKVAEAAAEQATADQRMAREAMAKLEVELERLAEQVSATAAAASQLDGELRAQRVATEPERMARERLARQIAEKDAQQSRLREQAQAVAMRLATAKEELQEKTIEAEGMRSELEPARREVAQLESRERSLATELAEANAHVRESERALADAATDVAAHQDALQSLRATLEAEGFVAGDDGDVSVAPPASQPAEGGENGDMPGWMREDGATDLPPVRGGATINPVEVRDRIAELRGQIRSLGPVNEQAATDYAESRERYDYLTAQVGDLEQAEAQLREAIDELEGVIRERFRTTFRKVNEEFERYFSAFFRGGTARLELGEADEDGLPGIEIIAQPPGKKLGTLALLSGGERSLTAVALLFALLQANPSPICVLDEVDAALDEANVGRFVEELRELSQRTQFVIITHNRRTIECADAVYGVTMGADNVSRTLSIKLADLPPE